ncbi:MAG TPA: 2-oxo acid dehydrogenase subunit E2 [Solirubrobacteraceae bacterium]
MNAQPDPTAADLRRKTKDLHPTDDDHRILYGADAARFLARIRELLEQPAALTL